MIEVQVQLPLVLEVVEQQALGHPRPLGNGQLMETTIRDFLSRMDLYKFKEGVDPYQVIRLLLLAAEGMLAETGASTAEEIQALFLGGPPPP